MPHFQNQNHDTRTMRIHDDQLDVLVELLKPVHILAIKQLELMGLGPDGQSLSTAQTADSSTDTSTHPSTGFEVPPSTEH